MPMMRRIVPTVSISTPSTSALIAYLRIAPIAIRRMEVPIPIAVSFSAEGGSAPIEAAGPAGSRRTRLGSGA